ncbi:hypothetical protein Zmor_004202 [Zophobas morio]|jgi:hypothetical protein|uniref:Uncharacterized protein n=1 Tax=Zophobas morio TaxID=2755281 RepID=A0AA38HKQ4_9CUCU|nr:hypothetical protein Zmor_004202 [Zophobas morio]
MALKCFAPHVYDVDVYDYFGLLIGKVRRTVKPQLKEELQQLKEKIDKEHFKRSRDQELEALCPRKATWKQTVLQSEVGGENLYCSSSEDDGGAEWQASTPQERPHSSPRKTPADSHSAAISPKCGQSSSSEELEALSDENGENMDPQKPPRRLLRRKIIDSFCF